MLLGENETTGFLDSYAINILGIPSVVLMENAAISFLKHLDNNTDNYLILCGKGNNGGDGYVIARHLFTMGKRVSIFAASTKNMSEDCKINYNICRNIGISICEGVENLEKMLKTCEIIIDSIFGTGLNSDIYGIYYDIIERVNSSFKRVYSVDIPSGINGNNGEVMGIAIKAYKTVSFMTYKKGFLNHDSSEYFGEIAVENIGISSNCFLHLVKEYYVTESLIKENIIGRKINSHKGNYGRVGIFAGSRKFPGAGIIAANSCVRGGSGLVTFVTFEETFKDNNLSIYPEVMPFYIKSGDIGGNLKELEELVFKSDVMALGPGIGKSKNALKIIETIFNIEKNEKGNKISLIIDADGINLLSENSNLFSKISKRAILTPHTIEFSRLSGLSVGEISKDRRTSFENLRKFAEKYEIVLLLKGKNTVVTDGESVYINSTGNPYMANGGMGDCLTGIIASLAGQGYSLLESGFIGAFLHGYIGDFLGIEQYAINATHIIENIPRYMRKLLTT